MDVARWHSPAPPRADLSRRQLLDRLSDPQPNQPRQDVAALVLVFVVLDRQPSALLDMQDLARVEVGYGPPGLEAPGLRDVAWNVQHPRFPPWPASLPPAMEPVKYGSYACYGAEGAAASLLPAARGAACATNAGCTAGGCGQATA